MTVNRASYHSPRREQAAAAHLDGLDAVPWSGFACGTGANPVPAELTRLADASDDQDWTERFPELLNTIMPAGAGRPDAEPAVTLLARPPSTMRAPSPGAATSTGHGPKPPAGTPMT